MFHCLLGINVSLQEKRVFFLFLGFPSFPKPQLFFFHVQALQPSLNREMRRLLEEYQELFTMANDNIRENIAREDNSSPQEYLLLATRIALDHARNALLADNSAVSNTNVFTTQGVNSNLVPQPQLVTTSQLQTHQNYSSAQNNMQRQAKVVSYIHEWIQNTFHFALRTKFEFRFSVV